MITFYFDLNGTTIKWDCVRNKILKNTVHSETAASYANYAATKEKKIHHLIETDSIAFLQKSLKMKVT
jgi:hypothetical protein